MSPIKKLTVPLCQEIETKIAVCLEPIAEEYGLHFNMPKGNLYPDGTTFAAHCQFSVMKRETTVASQKEEEDYLCYAESFGMRSEWLGKSFQRGHFKFKIVGLRVEAPKKCAILERSDGARSYENGALISKHLG